MTRTPLRLAATMTIVSISQMLAAFTPAVSAQTSPDEQSLQRDFSKSVAPFIAEHCLDCHGENDPEAKLDLSPYRSLTDVRSAHPVWEMVMKRIAAGEMPPADEQQPAAKSSEAVVAWIRALRRFEAVKNEGDPGRVVARRLSNSEYDYTIRDLTGVDIRPTREFPIDAANEAGFDNSAETLSMSPALLRRYLTAARHVSEHVVLKPNGIAFAPHPAMTDTDKDKYCVKRIVQFYERQPTDLADYFFAAWQFTRSGEMTLVAVADRRQVSKKYLTRVVAALNSNEPVGPFHELQSKWAELKEVVGANDARRMSESLGEFVLQARRRLTATYPNLYVEGNHRGSQPFVLWKNRQYAKHRTSLNLPALLNPPAASTRRNRNKQPADEKKRLDLPENSSDRSTMVASIERFCATFPDAFYISERGRDYLGTPRAEQEKGRLLSAGFHSMMGYFRDDQPLYDMVLSENEQRELDTLWRELDFVTAAPMRQYAGFLWFERTDSRYMRDPEFDFVRAEDRAALDEAMIIRLAKLYRAKAKRSGGSATALEAIDKYFSDINKQIRWVENARRQAESAHLTAITEFAQRAYRRKLDKEEIDSIRSFYRKLRADEELTHDQAIQDSIVSILMSPKFFYRMDLARVDASQTAGAPKSAGANRTRLSSHELASRLSYFLWSSMPDQELLARAENNSLATDEEIVIETRRMLNDERVKGMAIEFAGNWLDFRRFQDHNSVARERFAQFTDELREAMFEEPIRFFVDVADNDRSILDFLYAEHTFVNPVLAKHYGMSVEIGDKAAWRLIPNASKSDRGGLLAMAVFLTKNSPGLRTSPVKRGYWVARRVLGETIPAPPPNVPELPDDETKLGDLSLREILARHRDNKSCAGCHDRIDGLGVVFEGFGPIGERRANDLAGRPVEQSTIFPGGRAKGSGISGLRKYIRNHRQDEFVENLCRKLLSYALGRSLILSDELLVEEMKQKLNANGHRFSTLIETIVLSSQFRNKRVFASCDKE